MHKITGRLPRGVRGRAGSVAPRATATSVRCEPEAGTGADWKARMLADLREAQELPRGWDSYSALPPNRVAYDNALCLFSELSEQDWQPTRVAPSVEEGFTVTFLHGERMAAIECYNSGEVYAVCADRTSKPQVWEVQTTPEGIRTAISRMREFVNHA